MLPELLGIAAATFVSEDLTCIAVGALISQGRLEATEGMVACAAGIFAGDLALYLCGRLFGLTFRGRKGVPEASAWLMKRGLIAVVLSRFTPGLRLPTYLASGVLRLPAARFAAYLLLSCILWTPLLVGLSARVGEPLMKRILQEHLPGAGSVLAATASGFALFHWVGRMLRRRDLRRRAAGFLLRKLRWEFWPVWVAYLPLAPHLMTLAIRYRSFTLFTAANPGIFSGGFAGESKSEILKRLHGAAQHVLLPVEVPLGQRLESMRRFISEEQTGFPVVLKPDRGQRGNGVAIVLSWQEAEQYLREAEDDVIVQRFVPGQEFGVFYYRLPGEEAGRIFSITEKHFPIVIGDGKRTVWELILDDPRAIAIADTYRRLSRHSMDMVPKDGQRIQLVEIGSHCRGTIFLDGGALNTPALEQAINRVARSHEGFFFGRFDLKAPSAEALSAGEGIQVIELNGVSAEATHVYDPSVSIAEAYRVMRTQWSLAFEIGSRNRALGAQPMRFIDLYRLVVRM